MGKVEKKKIGNRIHFFQEKKEVLVHARERGGGFNLECDSVDWEGEFDPFLWTYHQECITCENCLAGRGINNVRTRVDN